MYILSELIKLSPTVKNLPLPWYLRASLGFLSQTACFVAFVLARDDKGRPVPDIVVSVLNPVNWHNMIKIECSRDEAPGVIAAAFEAVGETNISLAESITTDEGSRHSTTLICEVQGNNNPKRVSHRIRQRLRHSGFKAVNVTPFQIQQNVVWNDVGIVERGWVTRSRWREEFIKRYAGIAQENNIDLNRVVVTVDSATRALRFVFPYKGARNISVEHADTPGALRTITSALMDCGLNLLSAILRRGGAKPGNAVLMATAEPKTGQTPSDLTARIQQKVREIPVKYRPVLTIHDGKEAPKLIWANDPDTVVAPCPSFLWQIVASEKSRLPKGKIPVFFSRRFTDQGRAEMIAKYVREVASENGCVLLEANPPQGQTPMTIFHEVSAKMWLAEGGIVLVVAPEEKNSEALGFNLPHEFGFLQGQAKPILLLVEGGCSDALRGWSNVYGIHAPQFADEMLAFDPQHPHSIRQVVREWISAFKQSRDHN